MSSAVWVRTSALAVRPGDHICIPGHSLVWTVKGFLAFRDQRGDTRVHLTFDRDTWEGPTDFTFERLEVV